MSAWLKASLLIFPIFGCVCAFIADRLISRNDDVETALLWFFYGVGLVATYVAWWEFAWRYYYKQWSKNIFGEYFVSNVVILIAAWPTFILLLLLLGVLIGSILEQGKMLSVYAILLFQGTGKVVSYIVDVLV